ncbi:IPT/TIG domain-containing protein [Dactylosporangium sp. CA-139066]|uniref:IPT/TIG domain-containing protein n=1 Tax=Dactylosporangium sp. CA-139066 TaxID=3239930 RepID=UPI003D8D039F
MLHQLWRKRAVALGLGAGAATATIVAGLPHVAYADALTGTIAITSPTSGKLAAATAKQVILLTVTGQPLSEAFVTSVDLGSDPACAGLVSYIVTSATTIAVKTPTGGCAATDTTANPNGEPIVINFAGSNTLTKTPSATAKGVFFVAAPSIAATNAVITENSSLLTTPVSRFVTNGGQTVRVSAGASFAFDPRSSASLGVTFGGKAGTEVKVYDGTTNAQIPASTSTAPAAGNYLTFKTATGMSASDSSLTVTQNGVSKTFTSTDTGASIVASPTVTSLSVTSGKTKAQTSTVITGTGFDKTLADYTSGDWLVNFCGKAATVTAVDTTGTKLTVTTPDVADDPTGLGTGKFAGPCPVTVVNNTVPASPVPSPITPGSYFTFLSE